MEGGELARRSGLWPVGAAIVLGLGLGVFTGSSHPATPPAACYPVFDRNLRYQALAKQADHHCALSRSFGPATATLDGKLVKPSECPRNPRLPGCGGRRDS